MKKGLVEYDDTFKLMNESFRNYILSTIDRDEAKQQVMKELSRRGKWKTNYKAPIFLCVLAMAVFFAFQGDLLNKFDAMLTTVIGGIAIITKFTGLFSNFSLIPGKKG